MNRIAQGMVMVLLGAAALSVTVTSQLYLNYVQAGFRPFLIAAGVVLVVLGVATVVVDLRAARGDADEEPAGHDHGHGHDHARGPGVSWLMLLPVVAVFVIAPPALGAYTASTADPAALADDAAPLDDLGAGVPDGEPVEMRMQEFVMRAWTDQDRKMAEWDVRLTGFAVPNPEGEGWYLARLQMSCCAADAIVNRVLIENEPEPPKDSWWTVQGRWLAPEGDIQEIRDHRFEIEEITSVENPPDPYE
ncbi:TIGR03943 family putative permease subunit [Actinorugispora endophytica]|uniref:Putative repeat protein (TIGR03943 family) n=1 Tax=Actinorugispora endophytica TaxID=1605990 RepID=A0A4R6UKM7_9ACTN|nr:TIGR03943 family protein [Actinorugispora endophytica]TDQ45883.1 putative repeat protein (TIGR03943 family) [Actinorugispora endophytica]